MASGSDIFTKESKRMGLWHGTDPSFIVSKTLIKMALVLKVPSFIPIGSFWIHKGVCLKNPSPAHVQEEHLKEHLEEQRHHGSLIWSTCCRGGPCSSPWQGEGLSQQDEEILPFSELGQPLWAWPLQWYKPDRAQISFQLLSLMSNKMFGYFFMCLNSILW